MHCLFSKLVLSPTNLYCQEYHHMFPKCQRYTCRCSYYNKGTCFEELDSPSHTWNTGKGDAYRSDNVVQCKNSVSWYLIVWSRRTHMVSVPSFYVHSDINWLLRVWLYLAFCLCLQGRIRLIVIRLPFEIDFPVVSPETDVSRLSLSLPLCCALNTLAR
jgi:hypothetical protein